MKNSVIFYRDWWEVIESYPEEERVPVIEAVLGYAFNGVVPEDRYLNAVTALMRKTIDRDNGKYEDVSRKRKEAAAKRWKASKSIQEDASDANNADNDNENVNDNEPTNVGDNKEKPSKEGKKKEAPTKDRRFVKPTVEQVEAYCRERGNGVNAEAFIAFYDSKGWMVGSNHMKDWKGAVRTWEQRDGRAPRKNQSGAALGVGEWIDERGERRYGSGNHTVPLNAPPRPGEGCYWSQESKNWVSGV